MTSKRDSCRLGTAIVVAVLALRCVNCQLMFLMNRGGTQCSQSVAMRQGQWVDLYGSYYATGDTVRTDNFKPFTCWNYFYRDPMDTSVYRYGSRYNVSFANNSDRPLTLDPEGCNVTFTIRDGASLQTALDCRDTDAEGFLSRTDKLNVTLTVASQVSSDLYSVSVSVQLVDELAPDVSLMMGARSVVETSTPVGVIVGTCVAVAVVVVAMGIGTYVWRRKHPRFPSILSLTSPSQIFRLGLTFSKCSFADSTTREVFTKEKDRLTTGNPVAPQRPTPMDVMRATSYTLPPSKSAGKVASVGAPIKVGGSPAPIDGRQPTAEGKASSQATGAPKASPEPTVDPALSPSASSPSAAETLAAARGGDRHSALSVSSGQSGSMATASSQPSTVRSNASVPEARATSSASAVGSKPSRSKASPTPSTVRSKPSRSKDSGLAQRSSSPRPGTSASASSNGPLKRKETIAASTSASP